MTDTETAKQMRERIDVLNEKATPCDWKWSGGKVGDIEFVIALRNAWPAISARLARLERIEAELHGAGFYEAWALGLEFQAEVPYSGDRDKYYEAVEGIKSCRGYLLRLTAALDALEGKEAADAE